MQFSRLVSLATLVGCTLGALFPRGGYGQTPLRNLQGPQGGTILYGTVDGAATPAAAMGNILKNLHAQYADRPQVGRVFKVKGTESDAVFFTLMRHSPTPLKIAGMLLVSDAPGHIEAALLSDDASRFGTSINPMLQMLFANWKPKGKTLRGSDAAAPAAALRPFRLQDGSAAVMLAEGWRVNPASGGGTILALGPRGETIAFGFPFLAYNSNDPHTNQMRQFAMSPAGRNTMYAKAMYAPYGADLGKTFMDLNSQARRLGNPAVVPSEVEQSRALSSGGEAHCAYLAGRSPASSQQQALVFEGTFCQSTPDASGGFMNLANLAYAPAAVADAERGTLRAMLGSFQVNAAVVSRQAAALAKPTVDAIHEIGRQVTARIQESDRQNAEQKSSFEAHNDAMDRSSQGFSNYLLDKSVIVDTQNNAHGTTWNSTAEAVVKSDPNRFEYVDTPNYWKGVDY